MEASVVLISKGDHLKLSRTLLCLSKQSIKNFEVLVCEGQFSTKTLSIINSYSNKIDVKYIYSDKIIESRAKILNSGVNNSKNEILLFIEEGIIIPVDLVEKVVKSHKSTPETAFIGYAYGYHQLPGHPANRILKPIYLSNNPMDCLNHPITLSFLDSRQSYLGRAGYKLNTISIPWTFWNLCLASIEKSLISEIGYFDEECIGDRMVDIELGYRIWKARKNIDVNMDIKGLLLEREIERRPSQEECLKFFRKHSGISVEMFCLQTNLSIHSMHRHFAQGKEYLTSNYHGLGSLLSQYVMGKILLIGSDANCVISGINAEKRYVIDFNELELNDPSVVKLIGFYTCESNKEYDCIVVCDTWRIIPKVLFKRYIDELNRIGKKVLFVYTIGLNIPQLVYPTYREVNELNDFHVYAQSDNFIVFGLDMEK